MTVVDGGDVDGERNFILRGDVSPFLGDSMGAAGRISLIGMGRGALLEPRLRSSMGRGDNGTFHRAALSGSSSSESWYSSSNSAVDFFLRNVLFSIENADGVRESDGLGMPAGESGLPLGAMDGEGERLARRGVVMFLLVWLRARGIVNCDGSSEPWPVYCGVPLLK